MSLMSTIDLLDFPPVLSQRLSLPLITMDWNPQTNQFQFMIIFRKTWHNNCTELWYPPNRLDSETYRVTGSFPFTFINHPCRIFISIYFRRTGGISNIDCCDRILKVLCITDWFVKGFKGINSSVVSFQRLNFR